MKNSTILKITAALAILVMGYAQVNAQTNPITPEAGVTLYKHTTNSVDPVGPVAAEATDYVTKGGKTKYYVIPNQVANPSFNIATSYFNNINSTFSWTLSVPANGAIAAVPSTGPNYVEVTWGNTLGALNLNVTETASGSFGGCAGPATVTPIEIIDAPTVAYNQVSGSYSVPACYADAAAAAAATYNFPVTVGGDAAKNGQNWQVKYTVSKDGGAASSEYTAPVDVTGGVASAFFTVNNTSGFSGFGSYVVTITKVSDKISRKSGVWSTISSTNTFTYVIYQVKTGPIYHLPNN